MTGAQAEQLKKALEQRRNQLSKSFGQKQSTGSRGQQQSAGRSGQSRGSQRGAGQGEGEGEGESGQLDPTKPGHASRQVDPSAGHGPAAETSLVFGDAAEMDPERLNFEALPKGNGGEAEELFGLRAANPKVGRQPLNPGGASGAHAGDRAPGAGEQPMLPKNRALIQKYFDTK